MNVVNQCTKRDLRLTDDTDVKQILEDQIDAENDKAAKKTRLQNKIKAAGRMALVLKNMRIGKEEGLNMTKKSSSDGKINNEELIKTLPSIKYPAKQFRVASQLDQDNEKHPVRRGTLKK